jgi:DNA-binding transcriptional LysR family regulator
MMKTKTVGALWSHVHWLSVLDAEGSYTAAASRLSVSKAAVSYRISELEQAAGVLLVRRTTRSVRLTEAGQQLVDATRESFSNIERSFAGVKDLAGELRGVLKVTAPVALGRQRILPRLASFLAEHPGVRLELELSDRISSLAKEGFDVAIRHVETVPDTHVAWKLCDTQAILVATEAYLGQHGTPKSPVELVDHNCLHYMRGSAEPTWSFERSKRRSERLNVPIRGSFTANNSEALRELAAADAGIALLPDFTAAGALVSGRLVQVLPTWRAVGAFGSGIYAVRPYSPHIPRAVHAFVTYLRDSLRGGFPLGNVRSV